MPHYTSQNIDYSSQSFASNNGSVSAHSFHYGQHSLGSNDSSLSSDLSPGQFGSQDYDKLQVVPYEPSGTSLRFVLLHGTLDVWVYEAKNLPNMDSFSENVRKIFTTTPSSKTSARIEEHISQKIITSDPYVTISLSSAIVARSRVISNSQNPVWNQHFSIPVAHNVAEVLFLCQGQ